MRQLSLQAIKPWRSRKRGTKQTKEKGDFFILFGGASQEENLPVKFATPMKTFARFEDTPARINTVEEK